MNFCDNIVLFSSFYTFFMFFFTPEASRYTPRRDPDKTVAPQLLALWCNTLALWPLFVESAASVAGASFLGC